MESNVRKSMDFVGDKVIYVEKWPWTFGPDYPWWKHFNRPVPSVRHHPLLQQVKRVFIDGGFRGEFVRKMADLYQMEVVIFQKVVRQAGNFFVHATRRVVERSRGRTTNDRRLARCYE